MTIRFVVDPALTDELRARVVALWTDVTNAGGAVGFVRPVTAAQVWPLAEQAFAGVVDGPDRIIIGFDEAGPDDEDQDSNGGHEAGCRPVAVAFVIDHRFALKAHWRVLKRVMVAPDRQGLGLGAELMREAERLGRAQGWAALHVTVRDGQGTDKFYARLGYREVGRLPGALRVGDGDDRDEILMWLCLD
jgi:GNAT superfamily N-acetyltransferase